MNAVTCSQCGSISPSELASSIERPPCIVCGATALHIGVSIVESIAISETASAMLIPGNQARDWKARWEQIQREFTAISTPNFEVMSRELIFAWRDRLLSFLIDTYHLKDALNEAAPVLGMKRETIESALESDLRLALLADIANLAKHFKLTRKTKSGIIPILGTASGRDSLTGDGWLLAVEIHHGARTLDGLQVANDAVEAWNEKLMMWGLI